MAPSTPHLAFVANDIAMNFTSKIVALSSAMAFALQIALAFLMLRYFSPEEVGIFSVISQIGFFWATLALAQSPLRLLANQGVSISDDARHAWDSSVQRYVWLLPVAALAVWLSGLSFVNALLWALLLSLCQLTWMLAQSMRLRMPGSWEQIGVRVLPPLVALLFASSAVLVQWSGPALLSAALLGYAVGAAWFFSVFIDSHQLNKVTNTSTQLEEASLSTTVQDSAHSSLPSVSADNRSASLRMAHSLVDALLATAIVVVWQRLYGAQETGWMAAPLRVMGFLPAVVHMAWAQVLLAQPHHARTNPLWVGFAGFAGVSVLGASCSLALEMGWLGEQWQGVWLYLLPLVLWQGSACLVAAFSHRPFETKNARSYSWACIGITSLQSIVLLAPVVTNMPLISSNHLVWFASVSAISYCTLFLWLRKIT